jgi:hypothetical protein
VIGAAVKVMKIATGEIEEDIDDDGKNKAAVELGRKGGKANLRPFRRSACYDAVDGSHRRHRMVTASNRALDGGLVLGLFLGPFLKRFEPPLPGAGDNRSRPR